YFTTVRSIENRAEVQIPLNLRFAADELVVKSINYNATFGSSDVPDVVQIWCNITNDNIIGSFPNSGSIDGMTSTPIFQTHDDHFRLNNTFQTGNMILQFQTTDSGNRFSYNPQPLISTQNPQFTFDVVVITIEFIKYANKIIKITINDITETN